jgi:hypothetical protein
VGLKGSTEEVTVFVENLTAEGVKVAKGGDVALCLKELGVVI